MPVTDKNTVENIEFKIMIGDMIWSISEGIDAKISELRTARKSYKDESTRKDFQDIITSGKNIKHSILTEFIIFSSKKRWTRADKKAAWLFMRNSISLVTDWATKADKLQKMKISPVGESPLLIFK